jgi:L-amino acid N-acyltransferase YncA
MPLENINFVMAAEHHLGEAAEILNYYILNTTATFHKAALSPDEMRDKILFYNPLYQAFIIREQEDTIGYCGVTMWKKQESYRHTAEVNIYLKNGFCGNGIGAIAVKYLEQYAISNDVHNLIAGACAENTASIRLFEKQGFERCAYFKSTGFKFGRWLDMVYLQKSLIGI